MKFLAYENKSNRIYDLKELKSNRISSLTKLKTNRKLPIQRFTSLKEFLETVQTETMKLRKLESYSSKEYTNLYKLKILTEKVTKIAENFTDYEN